MPQASKQPGPTHGPTETEVLERALANVKTFVRRRGAHVVLLIAAALLSLTIVRYVATSRDAARGTAWQTMAMDGTIAALNVLRNQDPGKADEKTDEMIESCRQIIANTSGGPARWAQLRLATLHASRQDWSRAIEALETLIGDAPESPAALVAVPARAAVLEQLGDYVAAAEAYRSMAEAAVSGDAVEASARAYLLAAGRCYEIGDAHANARALYQQIETDGPAPLATRATARLRAIQNGRAYTRPPVLASMPPILPIDAPDETPSFDIPESTSPQPDTKLDSD
jgi:tetratricopeptide (TPR) repeat protein